MSQGASSGACDSTQRSSSSEYTETTHTAEGRQSGYEDVWTKIDMCRAHYAARGLGAHYAEQFIR